ncbi:Rieske (2Fe-2S) protein [Sphingobium boeckii]|uniref:Phenylpropionate dioxygenase-like ring-hydroxylating dioxygenase large terminal subunit n=1 Tax=Sphingobium boeckii TaxID=1082345 RepID=A0A7W9AHC7_9SPHN|nr:Rieske (2Fe-2S) protein [Sphingobium boeckii]MBB5685718.1 phenylpropionate dioxygenase-like ring-hydroxylating dioxygenase large terminal subunit [Sphingobium boeckii]
MIASIGWHPVAASSDLPTGHVYQTQLEGQALAVWRSAEGEVNVWEDRCPHRGVRFSIGVAVGNELQCQYHAWRFASGSGACTHIPAHPTQKPAAVIRATIFPVIERGGLVWTRVAEDHSEGTVPLVRDGVVMRALPVNRPAATVEAALLAAELTGATFFVQPLAEGQSVIRGIARDEASLRTLDSALERLRRQLEADHAVI